MRLGPMNRIVDDSESKAVNFDHRLTMIRIPTISIESTITILIQNQYIFYINQFKLIIFHILLIKRSIWINLMSIIQSKIIEFDQKYSNFIKKVVNDGQIRPFLIKFDNFWYKFEKFEFKIEDFESKSSRRSDR